MDRREFFRRSFSKASETVVKHVDAKVSARAARWIRPPYAIVELEFLLACTRCNACIDACPHDVIFPLASRLGVEVAGTPSLDLLHQGCHLCEDWPCVNACETKALSLPEVNKAQTLSFPNLAHAEIDTKTCLPYLGPECGACVEVCPVPDALTLQLEKPVIDQVLCVGCGMCHEACILEPKAVRITSLHSHLIEDEHSNESPDNV